MQPSSALWERWVLFVDFDQLDQALDSEVGERHDFVVAESMDPDHTVLCFHFIGDFPEPVHAFAEALGDAVNRRDARYFVDVHDQAARAGIAAACCDQFQGNNSSNRCAGWAAMRERTSASQA